MSGRGKPVIAPRGRGRRTQEERLRLQAEDRARTGQPVNAPPEPIEPPRPPTGPRNHAPRGHRDRGRGGRNYRGSARPDPQFRPELTSAGPFGAGSVRQETFARPWAPSKRGRTGNATNVEPKKIKKEYSESESGRASSSRSNLRLRRARESPEELSDSKSDSKSDLGSDSNDGRGGLDSDDLGISEDEDGDSILPIRAHRVEHRDRASYIRSKTKTEPEIKQDERETEGIDDASVADHASSFQRKGKGKGKKRLQIHEEHDTVRQWSGVFPDDDLDSAGSSLKSSKQTGSRKSSSSSHQAGAIGLPKQKEPVLSIQLPNDTDEWHTEEQKDEWVYKRQRMNDITSELGPPRSSKNGTETEPPTDPKQGRVYLIQFPSSMPPLISATAAAEMSKEERQSLVDEAVDAQAIKSKASDKQIAASFVHNRPSHLPSSGGHVGKLRVYKSGKTEMIWGGLPFKMKLGAAPSFYQQAVLVTPGDGENDGRNGGRGGGQVYSLGEVKNKFVAVPDTMKYFPSKRKNGKD